MNRTGNMLTDYFGDSFQNPSQNLTNHINKEGCIPFLWFDANNNYENDLYVSTEHQKKNYSFKEIWDKLEYKLNRGPLFYTSEAEIHFVPSGATIDTPIIFTQDGLITKKWIGGGEFELYPWDIWHNTGTVFDKEVDMNVIHLHGGNRAPEVYINAMGDNLKDNQLITDFAGNILKNFWPYIEKNRNEMFNSFPLELFYLIKSDEDLNSFI